MPFVPEDGTGLSDANSFGSVEEADAYFTDRGDANWCPPGRSKEALLILATDWIDSFYYDKFKGEPLNSTQALSFPRDVPGIPPKLKMATFELAKVGTTTPLFNTAIGTDRQVVEKKIGPITTKYAVPTVEELTANRTFPFVDMILSGLVANQGGGIVKLRRI